MPSPKLIRELEKRLAAIREEHLEPPPAPNRFTDLAKTGASALPTLIEKTTSEDADERVAAIRAIGMVHGDGHATKASLDAVLAVAKKKSELDEEMRSALFAIGKSKHPELVHGYCEVLGADNADVVVGACTVLGYARWEPAVEYLKFVVSKDDKRTAPTAIWALGQIGSTDALPTLHHALLNGKYPKWIPGALGDIGDPSSLEILVSMLTDEHPDIRFFAVMAIRAIVERHKTADFRKNAEYIVPSLKAVSNADSYPPTQVSALIALANLGVALDEDHVRGVLQIEGKSLFTGRESFYLSRGR